MSVCHICSAPPCLRVSLCMSSLISVLPSHVLSEGEVCGGGKSQGNGSGCVGANGCLVRAKGYMVPNMSGALGMNMGHNDMS